MKKTSTYKSYFQRTKRIFNHSWWVHKTFWFERTSLEANRRNNRLWLKFSHKNDDSPRPILLCLVTNGSIPRSELSSWTCQKGQHLCKTYSSTVIGPSSLSFPWLGTSGTHKSGAKLDSIAGRHGPAGFKGRPGVLEGDNLGRGRSYPGFNRVARPFGEGGGNPAHGLSARPDC